MMDTAGQLLRTSSRHTHHRPLVMGILNVTPDSFSDGGQFVEVHAAVEQAKRMIGEGADIIDIGAESTRPGANSVSAEQQCTRAIPVIHELRAIDDRITISIDTRLASVAEAAISAGADIINDVSALRDDPAMVQVAADTHAPVILMHMRGTPVDMQAHGGPHYDDVMDSICTFLQERIDYAEKNGVDPQRIVIDPGIGFGKRIEHNLTILRELDRLSYLDKPILVGASRKRFIEGMLSELDEPLITESHNKASQLPNARLIGSLAAASIAAVNGASIIRVHDVRETVAALTMVSAIQNRSVTDSIRPNG